MNLLKTIIERLNQRVEVSNIFDQIYPLCELNANGNDKAWVHYIGNGQAEVVTNFDAKQGTLFWAKRGKVSVTKTESLKVSGCKTLYLTTFPLTAYAVVRKSHLPCDSEDSQDWIASRIYRLISGTDPDFKVSIGVIQYEVIPNGYINEIKSLTANYEWACVAVDVDVSVVSSSEDGCYDVCATGDIPLPDFQPCTPCLTEVAVDGVTIIGNGTIGDPLVAIGGGGGGGIMTAIAFSTDHLSSTGNHYVIGNVVWYLGNIYRCIANNDSLLPTNTTYWTNLGAGFQTIERPIDWDATSGNNQILNKPTIPILPATIVEDVTATAPMSSSGGTNPDISITQADGSTDGHFSQPAAPPLSPSTRTPQESTVSTRHRLASKQHLHGEERPGVRQPPPAAHVHAPLDPLALYQPLIEIVKLRPTPHRLETLNHKHKFIAQLASFKSKTLLDLPAASNQAFIDTLKPALQVLAGAIRTNNDELTFRALAAIKVLPQFILSTTWKTNIGQSAQRDDSRSPQRQPAHRSTSPSAPRRRRGWIPQPRTATRRAPLTQAPPSWRPETRPGRAHPRRTRSETPSRPDRRRNQETRRPAPQGV